MATNADDKSDKDQSEVQTEDDRAEEIKAAKEQVVESETTDESPPAEAETEADESEEAQSDDTQGEAQAEPTFTKGEGFDWVKGETPQEAFDNLKSAYQNSSKEALKWKKLAEGTAEEEASTEVSPILRQAERREVEAMNREYDTFIERYPMANEPGNAEKLEKRILTISKAIQEEEGREPTFAETLDMAAAWFKWKPDSKEKLSSAVKAQAETSTKSSPPKLPAKSKVTNQMIEQARKFRPNDFEGKSDAEVAKALEPHVT